MPQEKTYNSAAVSTKSNAFGGAAVVKMVQVSYSQRKRNQVFYLYRDTDTLSYQRMIAGEPNKIVFGWMFRPVLGRRSVSPGLRQLFAIVSLPAKDGDTNHFLNANIRTYWKKYDRKTMTSFERRDTNRATEVGFGLSLGLSEPQILSDRYENTASYASIQVKPTGVYEENLRARVTQCLVAACGQQVSPDHCYG